MNFDPRALVHNTEIGVVIESPKIGEDMVTVFGAVIEAAPAGSSWSKTPMDPKGSGGKDRSIEKIRLLLSTPTLDSGAGSASVSWACYPLNHSYSAIFEKDARSDTCNDRSDITLSREGEKISKKNVLNN